MRWVDLDHTNAETQNALDIGHDIRGVARMQAAAGEQSFWIVLRVIGDKLVDRRSESDYFGRNVVDKCGAIYAAAVKIIQERMGRAAIDRKSTRLNSSH